MRVNKLRVEVVYALPERQRVIEIEVPAGATIRHAVERSRILDDFPALDPASCRFGVYGQLRGPDTPVKAGDRIEIYRPLPDDPKAIRRRRARVQGKR